MTIKIGLYLENREIPNVDFGRPELGNPGCGGTEFLFASLPHYINIYGSGNFQPVLFANETDLLPAGVDAFKVKDVTDAARQAKSTGCSVFVYRPRRHLERDLLCLIDEQKLNSVAWVHVTPTAEHIRAMASTSHLKAFVCVEHEQHDQLYDSAVWSKLTYIVNGFDLGGFQLITPPIRKDNLVVYLGALMPQKGFHLLAKAWPKILARQPYAELAVIGSGALYEERAKLGPWGIAEKSYEENLIIPFLSDENGAPHKSVRFFGKLGIEKKQLLYLATVGVPNPSGQGENCPGSALEFQACGTAVVSAARYGMLDTILDGKTGLLGKTEDDLVDNICRLLENKDLASNFGSNGISFIDERYNYKGVVASWEKLWVSILKSSPPPRIQLKANLWQHHKFLIAMNRPFQVVIGSIIAWPSVIEFKSWIAKLIRRHP